MEKNKQRKLLDQSTHRKASKSIVKYQSYLQIWPPDGAGVAKATRVRCCQQMKTVKYDQSRMILNHVIQNKQNISVGKPA